MQPSAKDVFIIIPAYNEEKHIRDVVVKTKKFCSNIIVVDDGSTDNTHAVAQKLPVYLISLPINMGKGYALMVGSDFAFEKGAEKIITLDSDGQHNPVHIPRFIRTLDKYDIAIGVRVGFHPIPFIRKFGNRTASLLIALLYRVYVRDLLCGFRGFTKAGYRKIRWSSQRYGVETEIIARIGLSKAKFKELEVENIYLDQFKGVTLLDAIEVFMSIPTFKFPSTL